MLKPLAIVLLGISLPVFACDPGQGSGQCGYYDGSGYYHNERRGEGSYNSSGSLGYGGSGQIQRRVINLLSNYGAVAVALDSVNNQLYLSSNEPSIEKAEKAALEGCQSFSKTKCQITHTYGNGCISTAEGKTSSGTYPVFYGVTAEPNQSANKAMKMCQKAGLSNCTLITEYEKCSLPKMP